MLKKVNMWLSVASIISTNALAEVSTKHKSWVSEDSTFKLRGGYLAMDSKAKSGQFVMTNISGGAIFPSIDSLNTSSDITNYDNGYIAELALNRFITENFAIEASVGFAMSKFNIPILSLLVPPKKISIIPVSVLAQYYLFDKNNEKYHGIRPYFGVGYQYQFMNNSTFSPLGDVLKLKTTNGGAFVGQFGVDIPYNKYLGFNVDIKHAFNARHNIKVLSGISSLASYTLKQNISMTSVMAGITFSF
jgi:outer membrane protein W